MSDSQTQDSANNTMKADKEGTMDTKSGVHTVLTGKPINKTVDHVHKLER